MSVLRWLEKMRGCLCAATAMIVVSILIGCSDGKPMSGAVASQTSIAGYERPAVVNPGGVRGLNYTPHYIVGFSITGENGMSGGGPNILRAEGERPAGGGAETCCIGIPEVWKPGMTVTIRWKVGKVPDGKTPGIHYAAEVRIPQYAKETGGMWAIFLPNDRVKVMVNDQKSTRQNDPDYRPADDDPFIAQGMIDEEAERDAAERRRINAQAEPTERRRMAKAFEAEALEATEVEAKDLRRQAAEQLRLAETAEARAAEAEMLHRQLVARETAERRCIQDAQSLSAECTGGKVK